MTKVPKRERWVTVWLIAGIGGSSVALVGGFVWAIASGRLHY